MKNFELLIREAFAATLGIGALALGASAEETVSIGLGGNAYVTSGRGGVKISDFGVSRWTNPDAVVSVFFSLSEPQKDVGLSLRARGNAEYEISGGGETFKVATEGDAFENVPVGTIGFSHSGYQQLDIRRLAGAEKPHNEPGTISDIILDGVKSQVSCVRDFSSHWGRRGASVHVRYDVPRGKDMEYFYNEVFVPEGEDPIGSYFMPCGFGEGYFGIQVNSASERRVLFSVWSPYRTDDPNEVPEDYRVTLKKKGEGVTVKDFGAEGVGGQSYLRYPWRAGTTYKFLVRVRPQSGGNTEYTGYFFAPEENRWKLIASFIRPKTRAWLRGSYSFLENFSEGDGWKFRRVLFSNQWTRDKDGGWHELTTGTLSCDETGAKNIRLDFGGGLSEDGKSFELKNGGFFNGGLPKDRTFVRKAGHRHPDIDFGELDALVM